MSKKALTTWSAALGVAAILAGGITVPANADPIYASGNGTDGNFGQLSGVGSDTIQDVDNGLQAALGHVGASTTAWKLASYDATGGVAIATSHLGDPIYRPNGSGAGVNVLLTSIGQLPTTSSATFTGLTGTWSTAKTAGKVQYARSSSGLPGTSDPAGVLAWVPFAKDVIGYAVDASSEMPDLEVGTSSVAQNIDSTTGKVESTLQAIYTCTATQIINPTSGANFLANANYVTQAGDVATPIHAYLPQSSSGTAKKWQGASGALFGSVVPACVKRAGIAGGGHTDVSVQEHDGLVVSGDAGAIMPFSVPQFVAQSNHAQILTDTGVVVTDRRHGVKLGKINTLDATTGTEGSLSMNPALISDAGASTATGTAANNNKPSYLSRTMYHVVPSAKMDDTSSLEYAMFGPTGLICGASSTITKFGFAPLSSGCGASSSRYYLAVATTTTAAAAAVAPDATHFGVVVTLASNGDQGGSVSIKDASDNVVGTGTIAAGSTNTTVSVLNTDASKVLHVDVIPNLSGLSASSAVDWRYTPVINSTTIGAKKKKTGTITVTIPQQGSAKATGTITIKDGVTTVGTAGTLANGTVTITIPALYALAVTKNFTVSYTGDANYKALDGSVSYVVKTSSKK